MQGSGQPGPALHERFARAIAKTVMAPDLSLRGPKGAVAISGRHCRLVPAAVKTEPVPTGLVAALTAQPLAALPPYGCGVPLAGCERLAGCRFGGTPPTAPALVGERHAAPGDALAICTNRRQNGKRSRLVIPRSEATWESPATGHVFAEAYLLSDMVLRDCHGPFGASQ